MIGIAHQPVTSRLDLHSQPPIDHGLGETPRPNTFDVLELLGDLVESLGDLGDFAPSCASCSRKSDHSSAKDSFRLLLSGKKSVDSDGVLGVRCHGEIGTRRLGFEAPGRARPACSRCSATSQYDSMLVIKDDMVAYHPSNPVKQQ